MHSLIRDKNGNVARTIFYNQNGEIDHSPSGLEFEKEYCSLTDFVKSFEQMQKDISTTELDEVLKEECVEPVSIKKETYRCAHDYVLKNQGYNSIDYLVRQYECSICGENKMTIQS